MAQLSHIEGFDKKLFQQLIFLVRDWPNRDEFDYGFEGGHDYIQKDVLQIDEDHQENMKDLRRNINKAFESIKCFLMPHPGSKVARSKTFDGRWSDIDEDFLANLKVFIPKILSPKNLIFKRIVGKPATARMLYDQIKQYRDVLNSDKVPNPKALHEALAERLLTDLVEDIFKEYEKELTGKSMTVKNIPDLQNFHSATLEDSKSKFRKAPKIGEAKMIESFSTRLTQKIRDYYNKLEPQTKQRLEAEKLKREREVIDFIEQLLNEYKQKMNSNDIQSIFDLQIHHTSEFRELKSKFNVFFKVDETEMKETFLEKFEQKIITSYGEFKKQVEEGIKRRENEERVKELEEKLRKQNVDYKIGKFFEGVGFTILTGMAASAGEPISTVFAGIKAGEAFEEMAS